MLLLDAEAPLNFRRREKHIIKMTSFRIVHLTVRLRLFSSPDAKPPPSSSASRTRSPLARTLLDSLAVGYIPSLHCRWKSEVVENK